MSNKEKALDFLNLIVSAHIDEAFEQYIHPDFKHHSPYFKGDRESLKEAMIQNAKEVAHRIYEPVHALEENNLVMIHGRMKVNENEFRVVHIFKFKSEKVIELWDASQVSVNTALNENGLF